MKSQYEVVRGAIQSPELIEFLKQSLLLEEQILHKKMNVPMEDRRTIGEPDAVPGDAFVKYAPFVGESLCLYLKPLIEKVTGKTLHPTYSCYRIYYNGSSLNKHTDRAACEYSISLCIESDPEPWGIWIENKEILLNPGDLVVYKGCELLHWREEYKGKRTIQIFLHFVDAYGVNRDWKYDGRDGMGMPETDNDRKNKLSKSYTYRYMHDHEK